MLMLMSKPFSASYSVSPLYSVSHQLHNLLQGWCLWQVNENMTETAWAKNAQKQLTFPCCQKPHWQCNCGWVLHGGELDGGSGSCIICASGGSEAICLDWGELTHRALVLWSTARAKLADHMEMNNLCVLKYSLDSIAWFSGMLTRTDTFLLKSLVGEKIIIIGMPLLLEMVDVMWHQKQIGWEYF